METTEAGLVAPATVARDAPRGRLLQVLGAGFGIAVIVGNTIAAGIVRTPGQIAEQLPDRWWFIGIWVAGGIYALLGALSIAELGVVVPKSGGLYVSVRRALGEYAGFVVGWSDWISTCGSAAAVAIVIAEYSGVLFPALSGRTTALAACVIVLFAALQWRGVAWGSRVQGLTSLLKALAFFLIVLACFVFSGDAQPPAPELVPALGTGLALASLIIALQAVIFTYDGWTGAIYFSEELKDPARQIPRAVFGGLLAVIVIYVLVNAALLHVLPLATIAGDQFAMGSAARVLFGSPGEWTFRALMVIAMLSSINAYHLMASRVLFAMSRDDLFLRSASRVNPGGTPTVALLLSTIVALVFLSGSFDQVIAALAFFFIANYALAFLSVFVLRRTAADVPRPYRAWGYPLTTGLSLLLSVSFLGLAIATDTSNSTRYALLVLALSFPVFLLTRKLVRRA